MSWKDLLSKEPEIFVVPWTGGRELRVGARSLRVEGPLPDEHGWHGFAASGGRKAEWYGAATAPDGFPGDRPRLRGYVVGDRLVPDGARFVPDAERIFEVSHPVHLAEPGLDRFARVEAARWDDGRWLYVGLEMPLGPEFDVEAAYQDRQESVAHVRGVVPALDLAFRWASWRRWYAEEGRRRAEEEARRQEALREAERRLGTAEGRREMAAHDFGRAAAEALRLNGSELLDWRPAPNAREAVVQYRVDGQRLECVVDRRTLRVIDAGICLVDHETGERGDDRFTLESLPGVIREARDTGRLVVFRHLED
jgi:hypothetical protein